MGHETNKQDDPCSGVHGLRIFGENSRKVKVNSRHHQCMLLTNKNQYINVLATHPVDSLSVEAIAIVDKPIRAVQWHPEDLDDTSGIRYTMELINEIVKRK